MPGRVRPVHLLVAVVLLVPAPEAAAKPRPGARAQDERHAARPAPPATHRIVGGPTDLYPKPGAKMQAQLQPGTPVRWLRSAGPDYARVETRGSVRMTGVVRKLALGLRVATATELRPERGGGRPVHLAAGADVRLIATRGARALVETVGVVVRGLCPRAALAVDAPEYVYAEPGGPVMRLTRAVELDDPLAPDRALARLETGADVVGLEEDSSRARVRTYGPVAIEGYVPREALAERERKQVGLEGPSDVRYEMTIDADLADAPGARPFGRVRGGTPVAMEEQKGDLARIVTAGDVRTRGWVSARALTRLAPLEELLR